MAVQARSVLPAGVKAPPRAGTFAPNTFTSCAACCACAEPTIRAQASSVAIILRHIRRQRTILNACSFDDFFRQVCEVLSRIVDGNRMAGIDQPTELADSNAML